MKKYLKDIPHLVSEYDFEKNKDLDFEKMTHGSRKKVWWKCYKNHEWMSPICDRCNNKGCPYCSNKKVCQDNCLATTHPKLAIEWSIRNTLKPTEVTFGSNKKVFWKCDKDHEWEAMICDRQRHNCPYCAGNKVSKKNCLALTNNELIKEWSSKNKSNPTELSRKSSKKVWWKCSRGHEWESFIYNRTSGDGCPYCSNKKVNKENCLKKTHPELAKEWSNKNQLKPTEVTSGSDKKAWWKCKECKWEWVACVYNRANDKGCPKCHESKGEKNVSQILYNLNIKYKREYRFNDIKRYRFDFALFQKYSRKPYAVIEYHGEQHYCPVDFSWKNNNKKAEEQFKKIQFNDNVKKQYCLDNNIKHLEIPYTEKNNIENIIKDFIK